MDPRLLRHYDQELKFVREMGGEFAAEFPKIAGRLGLDAFECADPYVERLLEGFAFLAARVQLKLESEFPAFTQHLLEIVYPDYLAPTPSMIIATFKPDLQGGKFENGYTVPRDTTLHGSIGKGDVTACEFRTATDATLSLQNLNFFLQGPTDTPALILEQLLANALGVVVRPNVRPTPWQEFIAK